MLCYVMLCYFKLCLISSYTVLFYVMLYNIMSYCFNMISKAHKTAGPLTSGSTAPRQAPEPRPVPEGPKKLSEAAQGYSRVLDNIFI